MATRFMRMSPAARFGSAGKAVGNRNQVGAMDALTQLFFRHRRTVFVENGRQLFSGFQFRNQVFSLDGFDHL